MTANAMKAFDLTERPHRHRRSRGLGLQIAEALGTG